MRRIIVLLPAVLILASWVLTTSNETQAASTAIGQNFMGSTLFQDSDFIPPDTMGAVGPDHFVELINERYSVYRKSDGVRVETSKLDDFWIDSGANLPAGLVDPFDPRVVYDHGSKRWFATSVDNTESPSSNVLLAVSKSSDPTAGWKGFSIDSDTANTRWADFPTLGVDADGVYLAANMFDIPGGDVKSSDVTIISIPKADLLSPTPTIANRTSFEIANDAIRGITIQPAVDFGPSDGRAILLATESFFSTDELKRTNVLNAGGPGAASLSDSLDIDVPFASAPFSAFQPDGSADLDSGDVRFSGSVFEVGDSLWAVHSLDVDEMVGIRWYEIDEPTGILLQHGVISDPQHEYLYPSIAANEFGDVVIGFSRSGLDEFVSAYAVVGDTISGLTEFGDPILLQAGVANYFQDFGTGLNRWGDYSATTLDPTDPFRFWTIQEWVSGQDIWSTQITELILRSSVPIPEPSTFLLLGSGLAALLLQRRKKASPTSHPM